MKQEVIGIEPTEISISAQVKFTTLCEVSPTFLAVHAEIKEII